MVYTVEMLTFDNFTMYGRLGNQMFRVASTIGIATRNNVPYAFPEWVCHRSQRNYGAFFKRPLPRLDLNVRVEHRIGEGSFCYKDIDLPQGVCGLSGYFQTERYFEHCCGLVRSQLEPKAEIVAKLKDKYGHLLEDSCSIHVRRGDYLHQQQYFPVMGKEYYERAIALVSGDRVIKRFLVFSDGMDWCREKFKGDFYFVEGNVDIEDIFLMSMCSHHIIANSSFGWWGAWLNPSEDKFVVAPSVWFGHGFSHDTSDVIPKNWRKV